MKSITAQTMSLFREHAMKYKLLLFLIFGPLIVAKIITVIGPILYARLFNVLTGEVAVPENEILGVAMLIVFQILVLNVLQWVLWRAANFTTNHFQPRVIADIAQRCFDYLHGHSYRFFSNNFVGSLVKKVNRLTRAFEDFSDEIIFDLGPLLVETIGIFVVLGLRSPLLALILIGWTILFLAINYAFSRYKLKYDVAASRSDTEVTAHLADTITNNNTVKLFSGLGFESRGFKKVTEKQFRLNRFAYNLSSGMEAFQAIMMVAVEFILFYYGVRLWQEGVILIGDLVLLQVYLIGLFRKLWDFGRILRRVYKALADSEEMVEILNIPHEVADSPRATELEVPHGAITFNNLRFGYAKGVNVFPIINLTIKEKEKIAFVGPSGSGKTTLVKLLFRFFDPKRGQILIDGQNIKRVTEESLRDNLSLVPQDPILFHRSLRENIRYGKRDASNEEVEHAAKLAHCDEFIKGFSDGYDTLVGERGVKLSGGERQRIAIARAILKDAPILVLDEATSSLDSHSELMIQDALEYLMRGKTVIVIAHRLSTIMKMDRIVVIEKGKIVDEGSHADLMKNKGGLYQRLFELQARGFVHS